MITVTIWKNDNDYNNNENKRNCRHGEAKQERCGYQILLITEDTPSAFRRAKQERKKQYNHGR